MTQTTGQVAPIDVGRMNGHAGQGVRADAELASPNHSPTRPSGATMPQSHDQVTSGIGVIRTNRIASNATR